MHNRYEVDGSQGNFEPGSNGLVQANLLGLTDPEDMIDAEQQLLKQIYQAVLVEDLPDRRLTVADLKTWHYRWLGNVYDWAGQERSANLSKGDFLFAASAQIPRLLTLFDKDFLGKYTPCHDVTETQLIEAVAATHVELILIHPFREGNGRLSRLLADVMAVQAGFGALDYSAWDRHKTEYFTAIQHGLTGNYQPMQKWVHAAIVR